MYVLLYGAQAFLHDLVSMHDFVSAHQLDDVFSEMSTYPKYEVWTES